MKIVLPTYSTKLPSTGKKVSFRPFTVREEKSILLALQEDSIDTLAEAIKNVVSVCTSGAVDPTKVPYYDIEYLFLQIRSKSVGETIEMTGHCDCGPKAKTDFVIDIADVVVEPNPTGTIKINIPDTKYIVEFRHPSIDNFTKSFEKVTDDDAAQVVSDCIVSVYTDDEIMNWSPEEKLEFVESMTTKQQTGLADYLKNMPMVKLPAKYKCSMCGKEHTHIFSGFENFFL